ncbi:MAG: SusC/RagA family TonB-linked outer membrane protein [Cyclobacteriaceae bacterium]
MKSIFTLNRCLSVVLLFILASPFQLLAQEKRITGRITSAEDKAPLPGVSVVEKGTTNGTASDADGNFTLSVSENATLLLTSIGYTSQEISVSGRSRIDVTMEVEVAALKEIVVTGYGSTEKKDLTGSVVSVSSRNFNRGVMTSPQDLILGRIAGVQVTQGSGAPGSGAQIRIRGGSSVNASNDPLIIIDGFPIDNNGPAGLANSLSSINPNDIESFTVLKDASATAIYGSRASNGVIIITTKKGRDQKPEFSYNVQVSQSEPTKFIDVLSADEFREKVTALSGTLGIDETALQRLGTGNTDWQREIFRSAISQDHNLSASGSFKGMPFRISYGYTDQQGILKSTDMQRHSVNANLSKNLLKDQLKLNASVKYMTAKNNFGDQGAVGSAVGFDPTQEIRNGNTRFGGYFTWTSLPNVSNALNPNGNPNTLAPTNPFALIDFTNNQSEVNRFIGNVEANYYVPAIKGLRLHLVAGLDKSESTGFNNASTLMPYTNSQGRLLDYTGSNESRLLDFYAAYNKSFGNHKLDLTAGYSYQNFQRNSTVFSRNADESEFFTYDTNDSGEKVPFVAIPNPNTLISFFGRVNYSVDSRYLITATLRTDGSSRFSEENRWGVFPSIAGAWRINEEAFLKNSSLVSDLKLRVGYGVTGQQDIGGTYPYLPTYVESTGTAQYQFGNTFFSTLRPSAYDANIKWEETATTNIGLDFGFFKNRITGALELYTRETKDLINFIPIPAGSNFSNFLTTNVGNLTNKGVELTLNTQVIKSNRLNWNVGMNISHNINEITRLTKTDDPNYQGINVGGIAGGVGNTIQIQKVGYPANSFYVFRQVYDDAGKPIEGLYVDKTGNGGNVTGNELNKFVYQSPAPILLFGLNTSLSIGNFDMAVSGRYSYGNYVYNNGASGTHLNAIYVASGFFNNLRSSINETDFINPQYFSSHYVENASFFRLDNVNFGYNFFNNVTKSTRVKMRAGVTLQNYLVITNYTGLDPEVAGGIDNNLYPRPRVTLLNLNITF